MQQRFSTICWSDVGDVNIVFGRWRRRWRLRARFDCYSFGLDLYDTINEVFTMDWTRKYTYPLRKCFAFSNIDNIAFNKVGVETLYTCQDHISNVTCRKKIRWGDVEINNERTRVIRPLPQISTAQILSYIRTTLSRRQQRHQPNPIPTERPYADG